MSEKILEILVFVLGGSAYGLMEILFRGHTHWTMVITGGACILTLYLLSGWLMSIPLILAAASGALIVTDVYKRQGLKRCPSTRCSYRSRLLFPSLKPRKIPPL